MCSASLVYPCCRNTRGARHEGPGVNSPVRPQPLAPGRLVPDRPGRRALRLLETLVGQAGDGEARWPGRRIVGEERGAHVGEVDARRYGLPAEVDAAADGGGYGLDRVPVLIARRGRRAAERAAAQLQPPSDGAAVEHHQPGRGEAVDEPDGPLNLGVVEVDRMAPRIVQP